MRLNYPPMFRKSGEREFLEKAIESSLKSVRRDIYRWFLRKPLKRLPLFLQMMLKHRVPEECWRELPALLRSSGYYDAYRLLEMLEEKEGFPAARFYAGLVRNIAAKIPSERRRIVYVPKAGTDLYWAGLSKRAVFEDSAYFRGFSPSRWWEPARYSMSSLKRTLSVLKARGAIPERSAVRLIRGDSYRTCQGNDFNRPDCTLVAKDGCVIPRFLKARFEKEPVLYGAIIAVSLGDDLTEVERSLSRQGYRLAHLEAPGSFCAPYSMAFTGAAVFLNSRR